MTRPLLIFRVLLAVLMLAYLAMVAYLRLTGTPAGLLTWAGPVETTPPTSLTSGAYSAYGSPPGGYYSSTAGAAAVYGAQSGILGLDAADIAGRSTTTYGPK